MTIIDCYDRAIVAVKESPAGIPDMQRFGEDVVVYEASIYGKQTHQQDDVSATVNRFQLTSQT